MGKTHVEIDTETRDRLRVWKAKRGITYDEAINALLDSAPQLEVEGQ